MVRGLPFCFLLIVALQAFPGTLTLTADAAPLSSWGASPGALDTAAGASPGGVTTTTSPVVLPSSSLFDGRPVSVEASVDKARMYIGDVVTFEIKARGPEGLSSDSGKAGPVLSGAGFEIRDFNTKTTRENDEVVETRSFVFSTFTTGTYIVPPIPVTFSHPDGRRLDLATMPLTIEVVPVPRRPGEKDDIRDIKEPLQVEKPRLWPWILGCCAILAVFAAFVVYLRRRGSVVEEVIVTPLDAYEDAKKRLADLRSRLRSGELDRKAYHYGLAEILRVYLERRYSLTTLSETTAELLLSLENSSFPEQETAVVAGILEYCDLVKFARYIPSSEELNERDEQVDLFIERTRPEPEPLISGDEEIVEEVQA